MAYEDDQEYPVNRWPNATRPEDQEQPNIWNATTNGPVGGPPVPTLPGTVPGGIGGFLTNLLGGSFGGLNLGSLAALLPMYYASQRAGNEMREQAGRYGELGREAAGMASPISNSRRGEWDARLSRLYEDPQGFLESNPEFKAARSLGEGKIAAMNSALGHNLGGKATTDQLEFLSKLGAQYIGKERDDLMSMAGYQFDPSRAASMLMEGGKLQGQAEQAALAARLYPLGALATALNQGGRGGPGGGPGGSQGGIMDLIRQLTGNKNPTSTGAPNLQQILQSIARSPGQPTGRSQESLIGLARMLGINPSSLSGLWQGVAGPVGLEEQYGPPGSGDWTLGDGSYPWEVTGNTYEPNYGSWWEGDGYQEFDTQWQHLFDGMDFDPTQYFTVDDAWLPFD